MTMPNCYRIARKKVLDRAFLIFYIETYREAKPAICKNFVHRIKE